MNEIRIPPEEAVETIRFESERHMHDEIAQDSDIQKLVKDIMEQGETETNRRRLLASGLRVTERIIPSLSNAVRHVQHITHLQDRNVETYVYEDARQNASCMDFGDGNMFLMFSSSMLEKMGERELLFVIGHEFGHEFYNHVSVPVGGMLQRIRDIPAEKALKLLSWSRRAEISADRVGLLCCQDLHASTTAFIKLSCGLTEPLVQFNTDDYVSQMRDIRELSQSVHDVQDWYSSHPFNPLRVVALNLFWESDLLTELLGLSPATMSAKEADERIDGLLKFMEPELAGESKAAETECLLWGGYWVAASDRQVDSTETASIRSMVGDETAAQAEQQMKASPDPLAYAKERFMTAAKKCASLQPAERHSLVQKLIVVARADQQLKEEEKAVLREACIALGISPTFAEQILIMTE
jgi:uncharacterized tellurite resistance protein B-like protein